jgi:hypothetical protein
MTLKSVLMLIGVVIGGAAVVVMWLRHLLKQAAGRRAGLGVVSDRWLLEQQRSDEP